MTILWVDKGIDTGPILLQKEIDIGPEDTTGSLYFNSLFPLGIEAIAEAVDLIKSGKAPKIPQDDWSKPASDVYNLVRGCDPQPGAYLMFTGDKVRLYNARLVDSKQNQEPGEILDIGEGGIMIALNGGAMRFGKVRDSSGQKMDADEFAKKMDLQVGMRLGS